MNEKLNLTVPQRNKGANGQSKLSAFLLCAVLLVGLANFFFLLKDFKKEKGVEIASALAPDDIKELALKLEKRGLSDRAAVVWKEYIALPSTDPKEKAAIWYRVGKLYFDSQKYEQALEAFYRSESTFHVTTLESEINQRIQETLESLGKFAALRYELNDRVDMSLDKKNSGEDVIAEIGTQKITMAYIDQFIEKQVEKQLAFQTNLPREQLLKQKEAMVKRFSTPEERLRIANQIIIEEVLYRKAVEDKIVKDPKVTEALRDAKRSIYANSVIKKDLKDKINITSGDLKRYFEARKSDFFDPQKARISHILVKEKQDAIDVIKKIKTGAAFIELVKTYSIDDNTKNNKGKIDQEITPLNVTSYFGSSDKASQIIFSTKEGDVAKEVIQSEKGFHVIKVRKKVASVQKKFEEVKNQVYQQLQNQKERELSEELLADLKERYNVVIHTSLFKEK